MYHANSGVNRMHSQGRKLTTVKHKCYAKITMQYILNFLSILTSKVKQWPTLLPPDNSDVFCSYCIVLISNYKLSIGLANTWRFL